MGEDVSRLSAGMEVLRLSAEEQAAHRRQERRDKARRELLALCVARAGLELVAGDAHTPEGMERIDELVEQDPAAARAGVDDFADLCGYLGLEPPPDGPPGICARPACDSEVPLRAAMRANEHQRRGYCSNRCMRLSYLPRAKDVE